jgi:hypothetical protein
MSDSLLATVVAYFALPLFRRLVAYCILAGKRVKGQLPKDLERPEQLLE